MLKSFSAQTNPLGAINFKGTWDASTNTPTLTSSVGTNGDYYVVSVPGSTTLNGISNWGVGDWAVFNGSVWQRVEGGADVNAVNLTVSGNTTLSGPVSVTPTWNNGATTFTGIGMNVTDTASAAGSLLLNLQVGGVSQWSLSKGGATTQLGVSIGPVGSVSAPTWAFASETNTGMYRVGARVLGFTVNSSAIFGMSDNGGNAVRVNGNLEFTTNIGNGGDTILTRDAANTLAQRNGTAAQTFRVYNTFTDASNYERLNVGFSSSAFRVQAENAGTGAARSLVLGTNNTDRWTIDGSNGHFLAATDNTLDIGASGATRPRNVYVASQLIVPSIAAISGGYISFGAEGRFTHAGSDGVFRLQNNAGSGATLQFGGFSSSFPALKRNSTALETKLADDSAYAPHAMQYLDITDGITAPAAATGRARIYVDTADGDLKVIFADGTIKTIVTDT